MSNLYCLANSRNPEQREEMDRMECERRCVFCPENLSIAASQRILAHTENWITTENKYPYRGAKTHLLLIPKLHVSDILDLPRSALADFWLALDDIKRSHQLEYYGLGVRCGDCRYTGGTIQHVHVHLIVGDVDDAQHEPVRLKLSSRPSAS